MFNFLVYIKFKTKRWNKYSSKKRLKLLQKVENICAKKTGRTIYDVREYFFSDSTRGLCLFKEKTILIDKNLIKNNSLQYYALATLFHEQRHAEQFEAVVSSKKIWKFSKKYKWKKNMESYIQYDEKEKFSYYSMQSVERDANLNAIKRLKKLKFWFLKDKLYFECLESKIKEFDMTKEYAKRELGPFYKLKLFLRSKRKNKK